MVASPFDMNDAESIHSSGKSVSNPPAISSGVQQQRFGAPAHRFSRNRICSSVAAPMTRKRMNATAAAYPIRQNLKPCSYIIMTIVSVLFSGPPCGHDVRLGEDLQLADGDDDADEEERRPEHRQRDVPELPPLPRPIHPRRLVQLLGDVLQAGDEDDHRVAEALPDARAG